MAQRVLVRLGRINQTVVFLSVGAIVFFSLVLPGAVGGWLLLALAAGVGWLLAQTWPVNPPRLRAARLVILALLLALSLLRLAS